MEDFKESELSIVLPMFNEESVIESTIREIDDYTKRFMGKVEIIAVNDGSTDKTLFVLNQLSRSLPNLKVISHTYNMGVGSASYSGIKAATNPWVLLMDSDGQFHIDSLGEIWSYRNNYDILLGYRQKRADDLYRFMVGKLGNTLSNIFLGRYIRDISCGFRLYKREIVSSLSLLSTGGTINFEILYRIFKQDPSIKLNQYPIKHYARLLGKAKGGRPRKIYTMIAEGIRIVFLRK